MDYAEDGDLRRVTPARVAAGIGLPPAKGADLIAALKSAGFVDRKPHSRVHDWWEYAGPFLRSKYKRSPAKWQRIRTLYVTVTEPGQEPPTEPGRTGEVTGEPNLPNLTNQPNQPNLDQKVALDQEIRRTAAAKSVGHGMYTLNELESHRMPFGEKSGVKCIDLDHAYAAWLLTEFPGRQKLDAKTRAALQYRCDVKREETAGRPRS